MSDFKLYKQGEEGEEKKSNDLTYNERYPPSMFDNTTMDLAAQAVNLGLATADDPGASKEVLFALNRERYMKHLQDVERDGLLLEIIPEQTKEMCIKAVHQNPQAFKFVIAQDEQLCEFALKRDANLISYFEVQTPTQVRYALERNPSLIAQIHEKEDYYEFILDLDWRSIKYISKSFFQNESDYYELVKKSIDNCGEPKSEHVGDSFYGWYSPLCIISDANEEVSDYAVSKHIEHFYHVKSDFAKREDAFEFIKKNPGEIDNIPGDYKNELELILLSLELGNNKSIERLRHVEGIKYSYSLMEQLIELSSKEVKDNYRYRRTLTWVDIKKALGYPNIIYRLKTIENLFDNDNTISLDAFSESDQSNEIIEYFLSKSSYSFKDIKSKNKKAKYWFRAIALGWLQAAEERRVYRNKVKENRKAEDVLEMM